MDIPRASLDMNFEDGCKVDDPIAEECLDWRGVVDDRRIVDHLPFPFRTVEQANRVRTVALDRLDPLATRTADPQG